MDFDDIMITTGPPGLAFAHMVRQHAYLLQLDGSRLDESISMYRAAETALVKVQGELSEKAAENFNDLGDCLVKTGQLEAAEVVLQKALKFRDDVAAGGLDGGNRCTPPTLLQVT